MEFTIRVIYHDPDGDENGRPNEYVYVEADDFCLLPDPNRGMSGTTEDDGRVSFDYETEAEEFQIKVWVGSMEEEEFMVTQEGQEFTICYEY